MMVKFFLGRSWRPLIFRILWSSCEESPTQLDMILGQDPGFIPVRILQEVVPGWVHISKISFRVKRKFRSSRRNVLAHRRSPTPKTNWRYWLPPWWAFSTCSSWKKWAPVAQMEEDHHNGRLFGAACLLRKHGPYFDQLGRGWHIYR